MLKPPLKTLAEPNIAANSDGGVRDATARNLMVITPGHLDVVLIEHCHSTAERPVKFFVGSKFSADQTDEYRYRFLSHIILCMETGVSVVLKDHDSAYGSLYDMLNQKYMIIGGKKMCRVALGG